MKNCIQIFFSILNGSGHDCRWFYLFTVRQEYCKLRYSCTVTMLFFCTLLVHTRTNFRSWFVFLDIIKWDPSSRWSIPDLLFDSLPQKLKPCHCHDYYHYLNLIIFPHTFYSNFSKISHSLCLFMPHNHLGDIYSVSNYLMLCYSFFSVALPPNLPHHLACRAVDHFLEVKMDRELIRLLPTYLTPPPPHQHENADCTVLYQIHYTEKKKGDSKPYLRDANKFECFSTALK